LSRSSPGKDRGCGNRFQGDGGRLKPGRAKRRGGGKKKCETVEFRDGAVKGHKERYQFREAKA